MHTVEQRYLTTIRKRVCHHCESLMPDGVCGLTDRVCTIEENLQEVVLMFGRVSLAGLAESMVPR